VGENTNQIERDIRDARAALSRDLDRLGDRANAMVSWRSQYENNARLFLGAAFGAGLVLGLAAIRSSENGAAKGDIDDYDVIGGETYAATLPAMSAVGDEPANGNSTIARAKHEFGEAWGAIADGLVRAASAKAVQFLSDRVPGFGEQVEGRYAPDRDRQREWGERGTE
jgi:hypothetical protein